MTAPKEMTTDSLPSTVYFPGGVRRDGTAFVERRHALDGGGAVLAYSTLERLLAASPAGQAWIALQREDVSSMTEQLGITRMVLDLATGPARDDPDDELAPVLRPVSRGRG